MKTDVLSQVWLLHQQTILHAFTKVTADNQKNRLLPETASVGFIALHLAETMFFFSSMLFGTTMDFMPKTVRVADEGQPVDIDQMNKLVHQAVNTLTTAINQVTDEQWAEIISGPLGDMSRMQGLVYMMHHNSHHIGQMVQAMKKGKTVLTAA